MVEEKDKKIKELEANDQAINFTSHSKMGKMLMAKCRTLQEENEEIGNQAREGKVPIFKPKCCPWMHLWDPEYSGDLILLLKIAPKLSTVYFNYS